MLAVWNQQKRLLKARDQIFPAMQQYKPFDGTKFTNGLDNANKKFEVGKSWYIEMLRRKSTTDLEKLWYSLLKEKLALQSDKYSIAQKNLRVRDSVSTSFGKIMVSMARIKTVLAERKNINNEFNMLLEYWYVRNKQMSNNNSFELNKEINKTPIKNLYERKLIESPRNKKSILKEIKTIEREKNILVKKTQEAVIEEKKKEINQLKKELEKKIFENFFKKNKIPLQEEIQIPIVQEKIIEDKNHPNLQKLKSKLLEETKEIPENYNKNVKNLKKKIKKITKKEFLLTDSTKISAKTEETEHLEEKIQTKKLKIEKSKETSKDQESLSSEMVNFKKNPNAKKDETDILKQKAKKAKKAETETFSEYIETPELNEEEIKAEKVQKETKKADKKKEIKIEELNFEKLRKKLNKSQRKEITGEIKLKLRLGVMRLSAKYRSVLHDYKRKSINEFAPYRKKLYTELRNVEDITKVGHENNLTKPLIPAKISINPYKPRYMNIMTGKVKAPIPYKQNVMKKTTKYSSPLTKKEVSAAKNLINRKNRRQILSYYIKNHDKVGRTGQIQTYNKIQKIRSEQARDIFLKELSALKHSLKNKNSYYSNIATSSKQNI